MVELEELDDNDQARLHSLIKQHVTHTQSARAWHLLCNWELWWQRFVKVMPREYKAALQRYPHLQAQLEAS